jgi:hypothetical protein
MLAVSPMESDRHTETPTLALSHNNLLNNDMRHSGSLPDRLEEYNSNSYVTPDESANAKYGFHVENYVVSETVKDYISAEENYEYCPNCERKFFVGRLKLHMKSCKIGKPLKLKKNNGGSYNENENERDSPPQTGSPKRSSLPQHTPLSNDTHNITGPSPKKAVLGKVISDSSLSQKTRDTRDTTIFNFPDESEGGSTTSHKQAMQAQSTEDRSECTNCGRFFDTARIDKHVDVCTKQKKRAVFDTKKQRQIEEQQGKMSSGTTTTVGNGTMKAAAAQGQKKEKLAAIKARKGSTQGSRKESEEDEELGERPGTKDYSKMPKWKLQHENFIENIKFTKKLKDMQANGEDTSNMRPPETINPDYVPCPYCFRKFAPKTADRHIPKCKDTFNRPKPPKNKKMEDIIDKEKAKNTMRMTKMRPSAQPNKDKENMEDPVLEDDTNYNPMKYMSVKSAGANERIGKRSKLTSSDMDLSPDRAATVSKSSLLVQGHARANSRSTARSKGSQENTTASSTSKFPNIAAARNRSPAGPKEAKEMRNGHSPMQVKGVGNKISQGSILAKELDVVGEATQGGKWMPPTQNHADVMSRSTQYSTICCQYCQRKFAPRSAERHIPICKNLKYRVMLKPHMKDGDPNATTSNMGATVSNMGMTVMSQMGVTGMTNQSSAEKDRERAKLMRINVGKHIAIKNLDVVFENETHRSREEDPQKVKEITLSPRNSASSKGIVERKIEMNGMQTSPDRFKFIKENKLHYGQTQTGLPTQTGGANARPGTLTAGGSCHFCTCCGSKLAKHHKFCGQCGSKRL